MKPYLAVLKDSLREARSSRVLWFSLAAILLVLVVLAPFALQTETSTRLRSRELVNAERFVRDLDAQRESADTPAGHIWSLLDEDEQTYFGELLNPDEEKQSNRRGPGPRRGPERRIVRVLNELIPREDFFKKEAWANAKLSDELSEELAREGLTGAAMENRNLRLLAATFPRSIRVRDTTQLALTYAGIPLGGALPITRDELEPILKIGLTWVMSGLLGIIGVFAALLVTAFVIPRTFEPGEISLLLSKPVNRSLLFITKFFGSCVFISACATLLVGGVWLLLGIRFGIWEPRLLYCIPVYLFLFIVYYSVCATAGLIWRNAIVALVVVVLFWFVLYVIGTVKNSLDELVFKPARVSEIIPAGDQLFAVNGGRQLMLFDPKTKTWNQKFARELGGMPQFAQRMMFAGVRFKPTWDDKNERLLTVEQRPSPFGGAARGNVVSGTEDGDWERTSEGETPGSVSGLFIDTDGRVLLPGRRKIYEYIGLSDNERKSKEFWDGMLGGIIPSSNRKAFKDVSVKDMPEIGVSYQAKLHPTSDALFYFTDGTLHRIDRAEDGSYESGVTRDLETEEPAEFTVAGEYLLITFADGSIRVLNNKTLEDHLTAQLDEGIVPRLVDAAPDGSAFGLLTHDGQLWLFDGKTGQEVAWRPPENGSAAALAFDGEGNLMVGGGREDIAVYSMGSDRPSKEYRVPKNLVTRLYDWVFKPAHTVLPQPGEVDTLIQYIMTGEKSQTVQGGPLQRVAASLQEDRLTFDIWTPLIKNILFVCLMLGFACFYVSRRDF